MFLLYLKTPARNSVLRTLLALGRILGQPLPEQATPGAPHEVAMCPPTYPCVRIKLVVGGREEDMSDG
eukprot:CAMPEP_0184371402 /NCGR_PEP_ID=MMETSP1089-20130417/163379_1 /TAXON_ID=38269 ORGANISM="Gloeochaete wittrockiana, Strain SAG46.84" /NCGR_SAMPLE_ID=MMETSP1089 /ASSEMBLY_ACC=CAM_ASM_000445 /LENGTH=67 /DNA_ID=CAMNT_0026714151 /DNA_START=130 /DNA_END=333 /DNA_ORIENTATION=+